MASQKGKSKLHQKSVKKEKKTINPFCFARSSKTLSLPPLSLSLSSISAEPTPSTTYLVSRINKKILLQGLFALSSEGFTCHMHCVVSCKDAAARDLEDAAADQATVAHCAEAGAATPIRFCGDVIRAAAMMSAGQPNTTYFIVRVDSIRKTKYGVLPLFSLHGQYTKHR